MSRTSADKSKKSENVKVAVRCRPLNSVEKERGDAVGVVVNRAAGSISVSRDEDNSDPSAVRQFTFDLTYGSDAEQLSIYEEAARPIVDSVLQGYNGTIFACQTAGREETRLRVAPPLTSAPSAAARCCVSAVSLLCHGLLPTDGQTGTGKTHTMEGVCDNAALRGIMPNSFHYIFDKVSAAAASVRFLVRASFLEIYLDDVFDLLSKEGRQRMEVKESKDKGVYVKGISEYSVNSVADMLRLLKAGSRQRKTGATKMNEGSSRSHSILSITVETSETLQLPATTSASASASASAAAAAGAERVTYKVGKLNLVDLAGSERQKKTEAVGERLDEAKSINWSLTVLGNCIKALIEPNAKHVPYRDSKLTRLLQDSLGGNTKTVMIANVGPSTTNLDETVATLRYADRAKQIKNAPSVNADAKDTMLKEMQDEIVRLREMLAARKPGGGSAGGAAVKLSLRSMGSKELMKHIAQLPEGEVEERVEERVVQRETGWSEADVAAIRRQQEAEERRLRDEAELQRRAVNETVSKAESSIRQAEEELEAKDRRIREEQQETESIAAALREREQKLLQGGEQVELASKQAEQLRRIEDELRAKRERQQQLRLELQEAEENELLLASHAQTVEEELRERTAKTKQLWRRYLDRKEETRQDEDDWEREKGELQSRVQRLQLQLDAERAMCQAFVPERFLQMMERGAVYDDSSAEWTIRGMEHGGGLWDDQQQVGSQHTDESDDERMDEQQLQAASGRRSKRAAAPLARSASPAVRHGGDGVVFLNYSMRARDGRQAAS